MTNHIEKFIEEICNSKKKYGNTDFMLTREENGKWMAGIGETSFTASDTEFVAYGDTMEEALVTLKYRVDNAIRGE